MADSNPAATPASKPASSWLGFLSEPKPAPSEEALAAMSRAELETAQNELLFGNHLFTLVGTGAAIAVSKFMANKQQRYAGLFAFGGLGALADLYMGYKAAAPYRLSLEALQKAEERAALAAAIVAGKKPSTPALSMTDFRPVGAAEPPPAHRR